MNVVRGSQSLLNLIERSKKVQALDLAHSFDHFERVARFAHQILSAEVRRKEHRELTSVEVDQILAAAYLHDCIPVAKNSPMRSKSSELSAHQAMEWMELESFYDESTRQAVAQAIIEHSFSAGRTPETLLSKCLQDADRLESLGALGIYRTIVTGVAMGTRFFDPQDPWAKSRELDDRKFTLDHFFTKLFKLEASFQTEAGRALAKSRLELMRSFVESLRLEI